jgi:aminopeptidase
MTSDFEQNLKKYAEVIVNKGLNIKSGQRLLVGMPFYWLPGTSLELTPLVRLVAVEAYKAGARLVDVLWHDDRMQSIRLQNAPPDSFEEFPEWRTDAAMEAAEAADAILVFSAGDLQLLLAEDSKLVNTMLQATMKHTRPILELRAKNVFNMAIVFAPVQAWADQIFSDISAETRLEESWNTVFEICRVNDPDPSAAWERHIHSLAIRSAFLNKKQFSALKLIAPGTELSIGLPRSHIWKSACQTSHSGIEFIANIPTEEIFTLPDKDKTEGIVRMTKPMCQGTGVIEDIVLTFSGGRVIKAVAGKGEDILHKLLETDEGILRLGEVALVPHSSPISQSGRLFKNILIDENASNHIALGRAYRFNLEGGELMSDEEFESAGGNNSQNHLDFMIGSGEMDVYGIDENGASETVMHNGEWAFEV